jgi:hypothetical protein
VRTDCRQTNGVFDLPQSGFPAAILQNRNRVRNECPALGVEADMAVVGQHPWRHVARFLDVELYSAK